MSALTIPAALVDLLRETLVLELAEAAAEIAESGHGRADKFDTGLLEPFDAYRRLLERVGWTRTVPAQAVEIELYRQRSAFLEALENRLESERGIMAEDRSSPEAARQYRRAARRVRLIEAFMRDAAEALKPPVGEGELDLWPRARARLQAAGVALSDAHGFYKLAVRLAARGESIVDWRPAEDRHLEMLRLRALDGLTLREVGERTGVSEGRVRQILGNYFGLRRTPPAVRERAHNARLDYLRSRIDEPPAAKARTRSNRKVA
ncbi:MAG TPA: sigma factor-like helix-turn-helix DNA-binding protein [Solirubrobacteraceae bacterium]|jgi:hypothetical protein|nr:sigma factor-like helix-turn-helix DNA-binding protein [Solirubrobacteraceae bacterium]